MQQLDWLLEEVLTPRWGLIVALVYNLLVVFYATHWLASHHRKWVEHKTTQISMEQPICITSNHNNRETQPNPFQKSSSYAYPNEKSISGRQSQQDNNRNYPFQHIFNSLNSRLSAL